MTSEPENRAAISCEAPSCTFSGGACSTGGFGWEASAFRFLLLFELRAARIHILARVSRCALLEQCGRLAVHACFPARIFILKMPEKKHTSGSYDHSCRGLL